MMKTCDSGRRSAIVSALNFLMAAGVTNALAVDVTEKVVLTVSGNVGKLTDGEKRTFTMRQLEQLPQVTFTTSTPWYPKPVTMTGPLLRSVLEAAGAKGSKLTAVALDNYKAEIPFEDAAAQQVIVARLMDGKPMAIRNRGPLFIIYPFDSSKELQTEKYYFRSAWQLSQLVVQ
jgi:hypothetical protein